MKKSGSLEQWDIIASKLIDNGYLFGKCNMAANTWTDFMYVTARLASRKSS